MTLPLISLSFLDLTVVGKTADKLERCGREAILFGDEFEKTTDGQVSTCP